MDSIPHQNDKVKGVIAIGKTSAEAKNAWKQRNYKGYLVNLRYDTDRELIEYVEEHKDMDGVTGIFREALSEYLKKEGI